MTNIGLLHTRPIACAAYGTQDRTLVLAFALLKDVNLDNQIRNVPAVPASCCVRMVYGVLNASIH